MQFDAALAAQDTFRRAEAELGSDWDTAVELEDTFSSNAGSTAREAYEGLARSCATAIPRPIPFMPSAFTLPGSRRRKRPLRIIFRQASGSVKTFLASPDGKHRADVEQITELYGSFRDGLGLDEEDEIQVEFRRDTPKGGD